MSNRKKLHLAVFGAHIGDAEIMAGHMIAKYAKEGNKVTIVAMTTGEKGHPTLSPEVYEKQKRKEAADSAKVWGADLIIMPWKDGELPLTEESKLAVADLIREIKPDIILTHWKGSFHKDHYNTHHNLVEAVFYAAVPGVKRKLPAHGIKQMYFSENWEDMLDWEADVYVDITDVYDLWIKGIEKHALFRGEVASFRYNSYYKGLACMRGALGGFEKGAALMLPRFSRHRTMKFFPNDESHLIY